MDVVLFGATGNIGGAIAEELVARGHRVKGITRSGAAAGQPRAGLELERGDATDAAGVAASVQGYDAVVSAIGPAFGSGEPQPFVAAAHGLVEGVRTAGVARLLVVGGAGSLEVAPGVQAVDRPDFPEAYKPNALAQREALEFYRTVDDLDWTYVSPAAEIGPGAHIGDYQLAHHRMLFAEDGSSHISYADYADAVVDCLEQGTHLRERITVAD
ncbi:MAG TPA: NAD(P)H-binding protein [Acidimicrobiales bacterium]